MTPRCPDDKDLPIGRRVGPRALARHPEVPEVGIVLPRPDLGVREGASCDASAGRERGRSTRHRQEHRCDPHTEMPARPDGQGHRSGSGGSVREVAAHAGAIESTASRIMRNHEIVTDALRGRVMGRVRAPGHVPNPIAGAEHTRATTRMLQESGVRVVEMMDIDCEPLDAAAAMTH